MNYIKRVLVENFQSHEKSEFEFVNGLNVIVGPSDQGKSAVIRAIKWVLFNEPRGSEFIRNGASLARVEAEFSNGFKIVRERSSSKNRYTLINPDGKTNVFEGFGNDVPEEIKSVHGIYKVLIDSDSSVCLNIGEQLEAPFLIAETGSTKAKAIGRLTGVHIIDEAIRECISDIKKESQILSKYNKEKDELTEKIYSFKDLDTIETKISQCEDIIKEISNCIDKYKKLLKNNDEYKKNNEEAAKARKLIEQMKDIEFAENMLHILSDKIIQVIRLKDYYAKLVTIYKEIEKNKSLIEASKNISRVVFNIKKAEEKKSIIEKIEIYSKKYSGIKNEIKINREKCFQLRNIQKAEGSIEKISNLQDKKINIQNMHFSYNNIQKSILDGQQYLLNLKYENDNLIEQYSSLLKKISKCPVCFGDIDESTIKRVLNQYR